MCQAVPRQVLQVAGGRAEVLYDGRPTWITIEGISDLKAGDYVLVYAGHALERVPGEEAEQMLRFLDELDQLYREALG